MRCLIMHVHICACLWAQAGEQQVWEHSSVRLSDVPLQIYINSSLAYCTFFKLITLKWEYHLDTGL